MSKIQIFSNKKREMIANKFAELANITVASLVFAQFMSQKFNATIMVWGLVLAILSYTASLIIHPD